MRTTDRCASWTSIPSPRGIAWPCPGDTSQWWHELSAEENASLFPAAKTVANRMMERLTPDFVCRHARGRRIPHPHLFPVPTFRGDVLDRVFSALEGFQESPQALARLGDRAQMKEALEALRIGAAGRP